MGLLSSPLHSDRFLDPSNLLSNGYRRGRVAGSWSWPLTSL